MALYVYDTSHEGTMAFIEYQFLAFFMYSLAVVFGYYHYILRLDCD